MGKYAVVSHEAAPKYLVTYHTAVCAAWALLSHTDNTAALAHVFSTDGYYRYGEDAVRNHATNLWNVLARALPLHMKFDAVAVGGYRPQGNPSAALPQEQLQRYYALLDETDRINSQPEMRELSRRHRELNNSKGDINELHGVAFRMFMALNHIFKAMNEPEMQALKDQMNSIVSYWIHDALYEAAMKNRRIRIIDDQRFGNGIYNVVIDRGERRIYTQREVDIQQRVGAGWKKVQYGTRLAPHWGLTAL